jgi:hypothetical protein
VPLGCSYSSGVNHSVAAAVIGNERLWAALAVFLDDQIKSGTSWKSSTEVEKSNHSAISTSIAAQCRFTSR